MASKYLDEVFDSCKSLMDVADQLGSFANALYATGNEKGAMKLMKFAEDIEEAKEKIHGAVCENAHTQAQTADVNFRGMVGLAIDHLTELKKPQSEVM